MKELAFITSQEEFNIPAFHFYFIQNKSYIKEKAGMAAEYTSSDIHGKKSCQAF